MASYQKPITDEFIADLEQLIQPETTEQKKDYLAGVLAATVARMFELDIDDLLSDVTSGHTRNKLNGRIGLDDLLNIHLRRICHDCCDNFATDIERQNEIHVKNYKRSITEQYDIVIQRRHQFMHGKNTQATFQDLKVAYHDGEQVIQCLRNTLRTHRADWQQKSSLRKKLKIIWWKYSGKTKKVWRRIW